MNLVDVVTALDSQFQLLCEKKEVNEEDSDSDKKPSQLEVLELIVQLNCISQCDAKKVALYKCQKSSIFME